MSKSKNTNYSEIDDIREDLDSLKNNVVELTKHLKQDGKEHTKELKSTALEQLDSLKSSGQERYEILEGNVKKHPGQAIAIAFASGLLASYLIGRR